MNNGKGTIVDREHRELCLGRRHILGIGLGAVVALAPGAGWARTAVRRDRTLSFLHAHTGERVRATYFANGGYQPAALKQINYILRDYRINAIKPVSPALLDLLYALGQRLGTGGAFEVLSAYRSAETNALLSRSNRGVAKRSLHMEAKAIDLRVPGVRTRDIAKVARQMQSGGVGYYPRRSFVHIDVGDVRTWTR